MQHDRQPAGGAPRLSQLRFDRQQDGQAHREAVTEAVMAGLQRLPQAPLIEKAVMRRWAASAVEAVMRAVMAGWRRPLRRAGRDQDEPSAWDGLERAQFAEAVQILDSEIAALGRFTPHEVASLSAVDQIDSYQVRTIRQKLLQVPVRWERCWWRCRQRMFMQGGWRGGHGADGDGGWRWDREGRERLALRLRVPEDTLWLPGLLRDGSASHAGCHGRTILVDYRWVSGGEAAAIVQGENSWLDRLELSCQMVICKRHQITPSAAGLCVYDADQRCWHWREVMVDHDAAKLATSTALNIWKRRVMTGRPAPWDVGPVAGSPEEEAIILRGWMGRRVASRLKKADDEHTSQVAALLRAVMEPDDEKIEQEAGGFLKADIQRRCAAEDLAALGLAPDPLRQRGTTVDTEALIEQMQAVSGVMIDKTLEEAWHALAEILGHPPMKPGPIDRKAALQAVRAHAGDLAQLAAMEQLRFTGTPPPAAVRAVDDLMATIEEALEKAVARLETKPAGDQ